MKKKIKKISSFYDDKVVLKPWGYEYVAYRKSNYLSVTLLNIDYNNSTSLHCHPNKKSGFIILDGKAEFQLGLRKKNTEVHSAPSKRMIARGLFHSIKSISKNGLLLLEFETPVDKKDLVRFSDSYGRKNKSYEGKDSTRNLESHHLKFKNPSSVKSQSFIIKKINISIETHKNFTKILQSDKNTIFAVLDGSISDNYKKKVLSYGDVVKTDDFKLLSKAFKINNKISLLKVSKIKS